MNSSFASFAELQTLEFHDEFKVRRPREAPVLGAVDAHKVWGPMSAGINTATDEESINQFIPKLIN